MTLSKSNIYVGIELDETELHVVIVDCQAHTFNLVESFCCSHAGNIVEKLREIKQQFKLKKPTVILGLSFQKTKIKSLTVHKQLNDAEIYHYLKQQSEHFFGLKSDTLFLDYQKILESAHLDDSKVSIQAIVTKKLYLLDFLQQCSQAGLPIKKVTSSILSLIQALPLLEQYNSAILQSFLLLNKKNLLWISVYRGFMQHYKATYFTADHPSINLTIQQTSQLFHSIYAENQSEKIILNPEKKCSNLNADFQIGRLKPEVLTKINKLPLTFLSSLGLILGAHPSIRFHI